MVGPMVGPRVWGRTVLLLLRSSRGMAASAGGMGATYCASSDGPLSYTLRTKTSLSPDSWLLRISLPDGRHRLGEDAEIPTCIKVVHPNGTTPSGEATLLEKSYSPVSHPASEGVVELLVKEYAPRPGGGVGAYICGLKTGESMRATLKSPRMMHGSAGVLGRWEELGLVGGGTGIAPMIQVARIALADPLARTRVHILSIQRHEEDLLMRNEIDQLEKEHPDRLRVSYALSSPPTGGSWSGHTGRASLAMARAALPPPTRDGKTMVLVCGTDGFVDTWAGPVGRGPRLADGSKGPKVQGELLGVLAEAGYDASEVFKY